LVQNREAAVAELKVQAPAAVYSYLEDAGGSGNGVLGLGSWDLEPTRGIADFVGVEEPAAVPAPIASAVFPPELPTSGTPATRSAPDVLRAGVGTGPEPSGGGTSCAGYPLDTGDGSRGSCDGSSFGVVGMDLEVSPVDSHRGGGGGAPGLPSAPDSKSGDTGWEHPYETCGSVVDAGQSSAVSDSGDVGRGPGLGVGSTASLCGMPLGGSTTMGTATGVTVGGGAVCAFSRVDADLGSDSLGVTTGREVCTCAASALAVLPTVAGVAGKWPVPGTAGVAEPGARPGAGGGGAGGGGGLGVGPRPAAPTQRTWAAVAKAAADSGAGPMAAPRLFGGPRPPSSRMNLMDVVSVTKGMEFAMHTEMVSGVHPVHQLPRAGCASRPPPHPQTSVPSP
jgi:hypothetical protein